MTSATDTYELLGAFVDELARCGMHDACTSPGSRSAPLVLSLAREQRLRCHSHIDERCSGFFALGLAKASGCRSRSPVRRHGRRRNAAGRSGGTRGACALDRAECGPTAGAARARRGADDRSTQDLRRLRQVVLRGRHTRGRAASACAGCARLPAARGGRHWKAGLGVVHLNFPLREPLVRDELPEAPGEGRDDGRALRDPPCPKVRDGPGDRLGAGRHPQLAREHTARAGPLVLGEACLWQGVTSGDPLGHAAARFCELLGWPLLADPMSGARRGDAAVAHYDALLREPRFVLSHARPHPACRRSACVKAAARMACRPYRHSPVRARSGGRLAGPGERPLELARSRAGRGLERAHGHARRLGRT